MTPRQRSLPIDPLPIGALAPRAPRGYVAARIRGTQHLARRGHDRTLCGAVILAWERARPVAICRTCAANIAALA